jgi:hypothetical protein
MLRPLVRAWYIQALPVIGTQSFEVTWDDFLYAWPRVKFPVGENILTASVEAAKTATDILPEAMVYDSESHRLMIRVCYEMQKRRGSEPFWLSCRDAAKVLSVSLKQAARMLNRLTYDSILIKNPMQEATGRDATEYFFIGGSMQTNSERPGEESDNA